MFALRQEVRRLKTFESFMSRREGEEAVTLKFMEASKPNQTFPHLLPISTGIGTIFREKKWRVIFLKGRKKTVLKNIRVFQIRTKIWNAPIKTTLRTLYRHSFSKLKTIDQLLRKLQLFD